MEKVTVTGRNGPVELHEFVEDFYLFSDEANRVLKKLRIGLPTWVSADVYDEMQLSLWTYNDLAVNGFSLYESGNNYIALSVGLLDELMKAADAFIAQERLTLVFRVKEENRQRLRNMLYFFMVNFIVAHEFGHIVHGHLRAGAGKNYIDEMISNVNECDKEEARANNWSTQLREYDADGVAAAIQSLLFIQEWKDDMKENLSCFDGMFMANYLCFKTLAEGTGRNFSDYMTKSVDEYDHPHPGIRMRYTFSHYYNWLIRLRGENSDTLAIIESGVHAVISYEKEILETKMFKQCYFSVASTSKGAQHMLSLHNEWQTYVSYYNNYAYIPIEAMENVDEMIFTLNQNGSFI